MTRPTAIALVDLDDTLFQTLRKCPADLPHDALTPLGFLADGSPLSFATPRQMAFIRWISETALFIPVTARSHDALCRVRLPFGAAVCAHGGMVLTPDGELDHEWDAHIRAAAASDAAPLAELAAAIAAEAARTGSAIRVRVLTEGDIGIYVLVKHAEADEAVLNSTVDAVQHLIPSGWTDHRNGNNIALMPPWLGKQHAVAHILPGLRAAYPDLPVIGMGDSITDAPFMALCDFALTPTGSQLAKAVSPVLCHD